MSDPLTQGGPATAIGDDALAALGEAGREAGAYLEGLGKFDVTTLTKEEWLRFIATIALAYEDFRQAEAAGLA